MKTDWKRIAVIAIVLVFSASVIAPLARARGDRQGACYQACANPGQYLPAQCGQMCCYAW